MKKAKSAKNKRAKRSVAAEATHVLGNKKTPEASPHKRIAQLPDFPGRRTSVFKRTLSEDFARKLDAGVSGGTDVAKLVNPRQRKRMARGIQEEITRYRSCLKLLRKLPGEVLKAGLVIFTTEAAVALWLCEPARTLGGKIPLRVAQTPAGAAKVVNTLTGLAHGLVL